jgi:Fic family protein
VISCFSLPPGLATDHEKYLSHVEDIYEKDAYNSLSIEGYQVDEDLILRVQNDQRNPDANPDDLQERNALAARGYYEAFLEVKKSLESLFQGKNPGEVVEKDLRKWYKSLFSPSVKAEIIKEADLVGYRKGQVYIRGSRHVPLPKEALMDAMDALFECLKKEEHAAVRAVLGHFIFVYIHPYMDGNGRTGRFLMNTMFASGGYPWTVIRVKNRKEYFRALEMGSTEGNIEPLARFVAQEQKG